LSIVTQCLRRLPTAPDQLPAARCGSPRGHDVGDAHEAVVCSVLQAIDCHDLDALKAHPGLYETVQHMPSFWVSFPDAHHTVEQQIVAGDVVATRATVRGTHQGAFMGVAPTGRAVAFMVLMMDEVIDDKIVRHFAVPDVFALLVALGALPALASAPRPA
jgi:predicted ester cyclase